MAQKDNLIQWFPGHMAKTRRLMRESLPLVDAVVEIRDARIPYSSRNPEIAKIVGAKPRIILLNKADFADKKVTDDWVLFFKERNLAAIPVDCRNGRGLKDVMPAVKEVCSDLIERLKKRNMEGRPLRIMVVGIPNVGKSSFINRMAGGKKTKVEDRPGVTVRKQWIKLNDGSELLDMPGVLWPKFEDNVVGKNLAFTGAVKDQVMDIEDLGCSLCEILARDYFDNFSKRYGISKEEAEGKNSYELLSLVAEKRKMLLGGGVPDTLRAAQTVLDEFRGGVLGKISLEVPRLKNDR